MDFEQIKKLYKDCQPAVDFSSLRMHIDSDDHIAVRQDVLEPLATSIDTGAMVTVCHKGGMGYAATAELSAAGIKRAFDKATQWAEASRSHLVSDYSSYQWKHPKGEFQSPVRTTWKSIPLTDKIEFLQRVCRSLKVDDKIVDWHANLWHNQSQRLYLTSGGGEVLQNFDRLIPMLHVTANDGPITQWRTFGHMAWVRQQGWELLEQSHFEPVANDLAREALELLTAENCPSDNRDLILAPDQMVLQIHESIGHPVELDRILGDERNYAGTSFVTEDMIGSYQYGSDLLNVTFDPTIAEQSASYSFDDDGEPAKKEFIIKEGKLERALGGGISQFRSGLEGTANSRADSWRRPPIDRMANLNLEAGTSSFEDMVSGCEKGVYMRTNTSWSIDDSRNKFQFGCEWGQLIENGKLTKVVRNPNYRGISANFWRGLKGVGNKDTFEILGTPYCGKGEPNQAVFVGHASPPCLFSDVAVFGGE